MNSKIQPGQKLKDGDWCHVDKKFAEDIHKIEDPKAEYSPNYIKACEIYGIIFLNNEVKCIEEKDNKHAEYFMEDFKKLCENTFKD